MEINFALNYSQQAAALLSKGVIQVDLFKCPEWPDAVAAASAHCPVYVHWGLRAGSGGMDQVDWGSVEAFLAQTCTRYVNLHLYPRIADFTDAPFDPANPPHIDETRVLERMLGDVAGVVERFGPERVIVENVPYPDPISVISPCGVYTQVIGQIVSETGCGFLLDLSHARLAARGLGMDEREYIARLPVDRLRELHVTGLQYEGEKLYDHMPMADGDWPAFEWALANVRAGQWARPWMVTFEYGGIGAWFAEHTDAAVLAAQTPRLYQLVKQAFTA